MCLNLGGGQNMLKPVVPPTEAAKNYQKLLIVVAVINFILAFMLCFINAYSGIMEMILVSFLACSIASVNFCCLTFYMIYITLNWISYVSTVGLLMQNHVFSLTFQLLTF